MNVDLGTQWTVGVTTLRTILDTSYSHYMWEGRYTQWVFVVSVGLSLLSMGCGSSGRLASLIEVEGRVTVRGNEPFTHHVLETSQGNTYVLELDEEMSMDVLRNAGLRCRGEVYVDLWNGRPQTFLRVRAVEPARNELDSMNQ